MRRLMLISNKDSGAQVVSLASCSHLEGEPKRFWAFLWGDSGADDLPPTEMLKKHFDSPSRGEWAQASWLGISLHPERVC